MPRSNTLAYCGPMSVTKKEFGLIDTLGLYYNTYYGCNLWIFVIS